MTPPISTPDHLSITLPIRTVNPLNNRRHWRSVWQKGKADHRAVAIGLVGYKLPPLPVVVTITRLGRGVLDDDGLAASCKHLRDGIAFRYGQDDGAGCFQWVYAQERAKEYAVRIDIKPRS